VFESINQRADGDSEAISSGAGGPLDPAMLVTIDPETGGPMARIFRSKAASCQGGKFLVRSADARLTKADHFAYVPYAVPAPVGQTQGFNTVLRVEDIYVWHQKQPDGEVEVYRFAMGTMHELKPVGLPEHGYELDYCDGLDGKRAKKPSLLKKTNSREAGRCVSYKYGVWLKQIDCTLVSSKSQQFFIPTLKLCNFG